MENVSIIREKGQLTIPDEIRKIAGWVSTSSVVSITLEKPDEIIIRPHRAQIDEAEIWKRIKMARSIKGKATMSAVDFINADRKRH